MSSGFEDASAHQLNTLIRDHPLCWIVPQSDPAAAILMPVVIGAENEEGPAELLGHLPRRAAAARKLAHDVTASLLFLGPNRLIDPEMAGRNDWGPTWNFVSARLDVEIALDASTTAECLEATVRHVMAGSSWSIEELGARGPRLLEAVIGFRARVVASAPRMKLGQDEGPDVFRSIVDALDTDPLAAWMKGTYPP